MGQKLFCLILAICVSQLAWSQPGTSKRELHTSFSDEPVKIDASLDENVWQQCEIASEFVVFEPEQGIPSPFKSEIKTFYSSNSFYLSAYLYDSTPDSIYREFTIRDDDGGNTDGLAIELNPYNDGIHSFRFYVSASNVQADIRLNGGEEDYSWNAVWESATQITDKGWIVELRIPFSMLRIPASESQSWGFNIVRIVRRTREASSWNPIYYDKGEVTSQEGLLHGFQHLNPPLRLSLYPYLSTYLEYQGATKSIGNSFNGGLDLKYGINESFTLDMTLVPDFGQTKSDNIVLNLTPYETYYDENRGFFTEGTELFNKADLFYSRRIGKLPAGYYAAYAAVDSGETLISNPAEVQLINSAKLSGRTAGGLGIGLFNAITDNTYAEIQNEEGNIRKIRTEPLANYSIVVLDQSYRNNSYINFTNTNVVRPGIDSLANVSSGIVRWMDKKNVFGVYAKAALSHKSGASSPAEDGYLFNGTVGKFNGNYTYYYSLLSLSALYNPNDLGYLAHNNTIDHEANITYRKYTPGKYFMSYRYSVTSRLSQLFEGGKYINWHNSINASGTLKNYLSFGGQVTLEPVGYHDYFETRVKNRYLSMDGAFGVNGWYSSDYRKPVALDINGGVYWDVDSLNILWGTISPRFRINDHWLVIPAFSVNIGSDIPGYLSHVDDETIYIGVRNERSFEAMITASYVISNKTNFSLNLRHLSSQVDYLQGYFLEQDGSLTLYAGPDIVLEDEAINFNVYTMDLLFSWNFLPGSYLNVAWKNFIGPSADNQIHLHYWDNLKGTFTSPTNHSFSLKLIYFLDYGTIFS